MPHRYPEVPEPTADRNDVGALVEARFVEADALLAVIRAMLNDRHDAVGNQARWSDAGDLANVVEKLREIDSFLRGE